MGNRQALCAELDPRAQREISLSLVVPVYNEAGVVDQFVDRVNQLFSSKKEINLEIVFVNDGSTDQTLNHLLALQRSNQSIKVIELSRNFGKESALSAGLAESSGQLVVPMDADLQDPPELIFKMIELWQSGCDVVLAKRINRDADSWAKRTTASFFYRIHNWVADTCIPPNVGDFRLMDRMVVDALNALPESRRFMKGLFAWLGFRTGVVEYVRPMRIAGEGKLNGWFLWNFAIEGITGFSTAPLKLWTYLGSVVALTSLLFAILIMFRTLIYGIDVPGYASIIVAVTLLGGLQLMGIGVIGEYLGRTYVESKRRPVYVVRRVYKSED